MKTVLVFLTPNAWKGIRDAIIRQTALEFTNYFNFIYFCSSLWCRFGQQVPTVTDTIGLVGSVGQRASVSMAMVYKVKQLLETCMAKKLPEERGMFREDC